MTFPTLPYPLVVRQMLQFKARLFAAEAAQVKEMAAAWLEIETRLQGRMDALALEIAGMIERGETVKEWKIARMERYRALLAQTQDQLAAYTDYAAGKISQGQREWIQMGLFDANDAIRGYYTTYGKVAGAFDLLPVSAIEQMVGLAGDGSPLRALLVKSWPDSIDGLTNALINAIAQGKNPRDTARAMRDGFGVGFDRALRIARTEQLRVYREANRQQYQASGVVDGYKRLSARDDRVCAACLFADDGTVYPLIYTFDAHTQCRCTSVPVVVGMPVVAWQNGTSWFLAQNPVTQKNILGPGRFDAWNAGQFELEDVIKREFDEVWGGALVPKPLKDLVK